MGVLQTDKYAMAGWIGSSYETAETRQSVIRNVCVADKPLQLFGLPQLCADLAGRIEVGFQFCDQCEAVKVLVRIRPISVSHGSVRLRDKFCRLLALFFLGFRTSAVVCCACSRFVGGA